MKYITVRKLKKLNACEDSINDFINEFGKNCKIHVEKLIEILHKNKDSNGYSFWLFKTFKLTGICYGYYDTGKIYYKANYKKGKLDSEYITYYENGKISCKANFKNSLKHGERIIYHNNGIIYHKENYKNDELIYKEWL